jgi:Uma2 family endonuclease
MATQKTLLTAEELLRLPDNGLRQELLDGVLVEMSPPGGTHGRVSSNVVLALRVWADSRHLGNVLTEVGVILRRDPDRVRAPDVCFIAQERIPHDGVPAGYLGFVPDLIVEVVSPWDRPREIHEKAEEWLRAGAALVWVLDPDRRAVHVYRTGAAVRALAEADTLNAEPALPGFSVSVSDLFA